MARRCSATARRKRPADDRGRRRTGQQRGALLGRHGLDARQLQGLLVVPEHGLSRVELEGRRGCPDAGVAGLRRAGLPVTSARPPGPAMARAAAPARHGCPAARASAPGPRRPRPGARARWRRVVRPRPTKPLSRAASSPWMVTRPSGSWTRRSVGARQRHPGRGQDADGAGRLTRQRLQARPTELVERVGESHAGQRPRRCWPARGPRAGCLARPPRWRAGSWRAAGPPAASATSCSMSRAASGSERQVDDVGVVGQPARPARGRGGGGAARPAGS